MSNRSIDRTRLKPIVHIAPIPTNESQLVHLVAITQSGKKPESLKFYCFIAERIFCLPRKWRLVLFTSLAEVFHELLNKNFTMIEAINNSVFIGFVGVRLYFMTTTPERFEERPSKLSLVHVRMPPGCAPSARPERPFMVHAAYYRQGDIFQSDIPRGHLLHQMLSYFYLVRQTIHIPVYSVKQ